MRIAVLQMTAVAGDPAANTYLADLRRPGAGGEG